MDDWLEFHGTTGRSAFKMLDGPGGDHEFLTAVHRQSQSASSSLFADLLGDAIGVMRKSRAEAGAPTPPPRPELFTAPTPLPIPITELGGRCSLEAMDPWWSQVDPWGAESDPVEAPAGELDLAKGSFLHGPWAGEGERRRLYTVTLPPQLGSWLDVDGDSVTMWVQFKSGVTDGLIGAVRKLAGAPESFMVGWSVPLYAVSKVRVQTRYSLTKPLFSPKERQMVAERGYGPMVGFEVEVVGSDGWRAIGLRCGASGVSRQIPEPTAEHWLSWLPRYLVTARLRESWLSESEADALGELADPAATESTEKSFIGEGRTFRRTVEITLPGARSISATRSNQE